MRDQRLRVQPVTEASVADKSRRQSMALSVSNVYAYKIKGRTVSSQRNMAWCLLRGLWQHIVMQADRGQGAVTPDSQTCMAFVVLAM